MPKLRRLSGQDLIRIFEQIGFTVFSQHGSHIKLKRVTNAGEKQILTIPNHQQLDTGTCKAILRQASRYVPTEELNRYFYR